MPNAIYSGSGEYDGATLMAIYKAYLPTLEQGASYEFKTGTIYNISCKDYPNRVLLFMRVNNGDNINLTTLTSDGNTSNGPINILFSFDPAFVEDVNSNCQALDTTQDIQLILFHDVYFSVDYIDKNLFCQPASAYEVPPPAEEDNKDLESPVMIVPKLGKPGTVLIKNLKP